MLMTEAINTFHIADQPNNFFCVNCILYTFVRTKDLQTVIRLPVNYCLFILGENAIN